MRRRDRGHVGQGVEPRRERANLRRGDGRPDDDLERRRPVRAGTASRSVTSTWRALALGGSTLALTVRNLIDANGIPSAISTAALITAIGAGRRMTKRDSRYQKPAARRARVAVGGALQALGRRAR